MIILCVNGDIADGIDNDPDPIALAARQRELYLPSAGTAGGHPVDDWQPVVCQLRRWHPGIW